MNITLTTFKVAIRLSSSLRFFNIKLSTLDTLRYFRYIWVIKVTIVYSDTGTSEKNRLEKS